MLCGVGLHLAGELWYEAVLMSRRVAPRDDVFEVVAGNDIGALLETECDRMAAIC